MIAGTTVFLRNTILSIVAALAMLALPALASTINVPKDQPTIQAGINAASNGDTVLVAPGTYFENIDFKGKAITVTSSGGAASTILDGGSKGPAVTFQTSEPRAAVLSNMTIQHGGNFGVAFSGNGGIYVYNGSPTILNNVITQNNCWDIETNTAAPLIQGNEISATQDPNGQCSFGGGAGIYVGGNLNGYSPAVIVGNTIENNVESGNEDAGGNGGAGIAVWGGSPIIEENIIRNNFSPGGSGGAINVQSGLGVVIAQNLIYGNKAGCGGGAIAYIGGGEASGFVVLVANNTMVNNTNVGSAGYSECAKISQIYPSPDTYGTSGPSAVFINNIISGSTTDPAVNCSWYQTSSEAIQPIFDHNILYNAGGAFFGSYCVDVSAKYGNIVADPQLVDPTNGDLHLKATSPAVDSGNNSALQSIQSLTGSALTKDLDNNPRVQDFTGKGYPIIDIGAYELGGMIDGSATTIVLTSSAYTGNAGSGYTLTANLVSALGTPTGAVTFFLDGKQIGASVIGSNGVATLTNFLITPGVHNLYASYPGQGSFTPATSVIIIVNISLYTTNISVTSSPNPSILGQPVTFTVTSSSADTTAIPSPIALTDGSAYTALATLTPNSAGVATFTTSTLALGPHTIAATFAGDSTHAVGQGIVFQQVVNGYATNSQLSSSLNPANLGQGVTFTASVTSANGTPTGIVTFSDGGTTLGTGTLVSGIASYSTNSLTVGIHSILATYNAGGAYASSSSALSQVINGIPTTTTVSATPTTAYAGAPISLSSVVSSGGSPITTGNVTFMDGSTALGSGVALGSTGSATFTVSSLTVGTHTITAVYAGDATHGSSSSAPVVVTIKANLTSLTLVSSLNPARSFQPIPLAAQISSSTTAALPTGSITFLANGVSVGTAQISASGVATLPVALAAGSYSLTASFASNATFSASVSGAVAEVVTADGTTTTLAASPNPGVQGGAVTVTAVVAGASSTVVPTGAVTFFDGGAAIATIAADATGHATFTSSSFAVGTHNLTATYNGNANDLASTSAPVALYISPQDFTLTTDSSITIRTEYHSNLNITLASIGSFGDTVVLSCGSLPAYATCFFANNSPSLAANATMPTTVLIDTDAVFEFKSDSRGGRSRLRNGIAVGLLLPLTLLTIGRRRGLRGFARLMALLVAAGLLSLTGCSSMYPAHTAPGSYAITVTGQGVHTGIVHTAKVTLNVTE